MSDNAKGSIAHGDDKAENMDDTKHMGKHQGKQRRGPAMHLKSVEGKDEHAHPSHHAMNKEHGAGGFNPGECYEGGHEDGMGNEEHC